MVIGKNALLSKLVLDETQILYNQLGESNFEIHTNSHKMSKFRAFSKRNPGTIIAKLGLTQHQ